jgi:hypothetical protein
MKVIIVREKVGKMVETSCIVNDDIYEETLKVLREQFKDTYYEVAYFTPITQSEFQEEVEELLKDNR